MTQINAYLTFDGNCREAMLFYKDCFGGELHLQTVAGSPMEKHMPPATAQRILHASLTTEDLVLMGTEMIGREGFAPGNNVALCISCATDTDARTYFSRLAAGGRITCELADSFWGGMFGAVTDRFGIQWMVNAERKDNN